MQKISNWIATFVAMVVVSTMGTAHAVTIDEYNGSKNTSDAPWSVSEIGWFYTPSQTFTLTDVESKFDALGGTGATITVEIFDAGVIAPFTSDVPIFTQAFDVDVVEDWEGLTSIVGGPVLNAGSEYFIGFTGLTGVGVNITEDSGADALDMQFSAGGDPVGSYATASSIPLEDQVILRIGGNVVGATVPEPASAAILVVGSVLLVRRRRLRG